MKSMTSAGIVRLILEKRSSRHSRRYDSGPDSTAVIRRKYKVAVQALFDLNSSVNDPGVQAMIDQLNVQFKQLTD